MKRLIILLLATTVAAPAIAQHQGHSMPGHTMPMPKAKPKPAAKPAAKPKPKPAAKKPAAKAPAKATVKAKPKAKAAAKPAARPVAKPAAVKARPKPAPQAVDPHAGHVMPAPVKPAADPHAGHVMPAPATPAADPHAGHVMPAPATPADPHAGHVMPAPAVDPHAGHGMAAEPAAPPVAPPPPGALTGPAHAADTLFDARTMSAAREQLRREHGAITTSKLLIDRLEWMIRDGRDGYAWDGEGWIGGDIDKLWIKSEGEGAIGGKPEQAEVQLLWSHAIDPWFDLQAGLRYDFRPDPERAHLALGVQGLAPYWIEIDAAAFLSDKGDLTARFEAEYDQRITRKLILQPRVEFDLAAQDVPELGIGSGLSTAEAGLRLRYQIVPEFAPYVGLHYERAFGDTRAYRRAAGEDVGGWSLLVGVRTWF